MQVIIIDAFECCGGGEELGGESNATTNRFHVSSLCKMG